MSDFQRSLTFYRWATDDGVYLVRHDVLLGEVDAYRVTMGREPTALGEPIVLGGSSLLDAFAACREHAAKMACAQPCAGGQDSVCAEGAEVGRGS